METRQQRLERENGEFCVAIWPVLIEVKEEVAAGGHNNGAGIIYRELERRSGVGMGHLRHDRGPLASILALCDERGYPPLTVLVVRSRPRTNPRPGPGYTVRHGSIEEDRRRVLAFDWRARVYRIGGTFACSSG